MNYYVKTTAITTESAKMANAFASLICGLDLLATLKSVRIIVIITVNARTQENAFAKLVSRVKIALRHSALIIATARGYAKKENASVLKASQESTVLRKFVPETAPTTVNA